MNFANSPHLLGPFAALTVGLKMRIIGLLSMLGIMGMAVGGNPEIGLADRLANLETAVFGGPNVSGTIGTALTGSTDVLGYPGSYYVKTAGVDAMTLAAPTAGTDDYKRVRVISTTDNAHTITTPANTIANGSSAKGDTLTFAAKNGANVLLQAYGGLWYVLAALNVTLSEV